MPRPLTVHYMGSSSYAYSGQNSDGPLLGLVQGRDSTTVNIAAGNYKYVFIHGNLRGNFNGFFPKVTLLSIALLHPEVSTKLLKRRLLKN